MRIFSFIPALAALVAVVAGVALPDDDNCGCEVGCEIAKLATKRDFFEHPVRTIRGLTNAALLRRGLPLKNPILRRGTPVRRTDPSETPEPSPEPSPKPEPKKIHHRGIIQVKSGNSVLGYVSSDAAVYSYHYGTIDHAVIVNFETDKTGSGTQLNLVPENSDIKNFEFLGLVQGRDSTNSVLSSGSYNYLYLAGTHETAPGSPPTHVGNSYEATHGSPRTSESAVWTFDSATGTLAPRWVNPDGSLPNVQYFTQSTYIYIGGDENAFHSRYPTPVTSITFEFVPL
ncbi:hypothetical protein BDM02DRAFT_867254 [Thelephora ganbajun]|uniref:Uncharacterized protein n=1 Tax=Thelephora ganbajun TaxID=370292 RepID=A0ACB6ZPQ8_THEGA|nr:hypothetical protein BDM02DRAFT_867254 [Thelephora ganbajun]